MLPKQYFTKNIKKIKLFLILKLLKNEFLIDFIENINKKMSKCSKHPVFVNISLT